MLIPFPIPFSFPVDFSFLLFPLNSDGIPRFQFHKASHSHRHLLPSLRRPLPQRSNAKQIRLWGLKLCKLARGALGKVPGALKTTYSSSLETTQLWVWEMGETDNISSVRWTVKCTYRVIGLTTIEAGMNVSELLLTSVFFMHTILTFVTNTAPVFSVQYTFLDRQRQCVTTITFSYATVRGSLTHQSGGKFPLQPGWCC